MNIRTRTYSRHFLRRTARRVERAVQLFLDNNPYDETDPFVYRREQKAVTRDEVGIPTWAKGVRVESYIRGPFGYKVVLTETRGH